MLLAKIKENYPRVVEEMRGWDAKALSISERDYRYKVFVRHLEHDLLPLFERDEKFRAQLFKDLGYFVDFLGDFGRATFWNRKAFRAWMKLGDSGQALECRVQLGDVYRARGQLQKSLRIYKAVLSHPACRERALDEVRADALWGQADCLRMLGRSRESHEAHLQSLRAYQKIREDYGIHNSIWGLGYTSLNMGNYGKTMEYIRRLESMYKKGRIDEGDWAEGLGLKADVLRLTGRFAESIPYYKEANRIMEAVENETGQNWMLWGWGLAMLMTGERKRARTWFLRAYEIARKSEDRWARAYTELALGEWHRICGELMDAEKYFSESLKNAQAHKFEMEIAHAMLGLAETSRLQGKPEMAAYKRAMGYYRRRNMPWGVVHCHIGKALASLSRKDAFRRNLQAARELARSRGFPLELKEIARIEKNPRPDEVHPLCFP